MAYATPAELANYVSSAIILPSTAEQLRLLERASEQVDYLTLGRIDTSNPEHAEAAKNATMAQVEFWFEAGESVDIGQAVGSYSIGKLSINYGGASAGKQGTQVSLAPRARRYLFLAGLLYRGVRGC